MANKMLGKVVAGAALGGASLLVFTPGIAFADGHHNDEGKVYAKPHVVRAGETVKLLEVCPDRQEHAFVWSKVTGKVKLKPAQGRTDWRGGEEDSRDNGRDHEDKGRDHDKGKDHEDKGRDHDKGRDNGKDETPKPQPSNTATGQPQPPANGGQPPANGQGGGAADAGAEGERDWKGYEHGQDAEGDREGRDKGHDKGDHEGREGHEGRDDKYGSGSNGSDEYDREDRKDHDGYGSDSNGSDEYDRKGHHGGWSDEESEGNGNGKDEGRWEHKRDFIYYGEAEVSEDAKPGRYELKGSCGEGELVVLPRGGVDGGDGGVGVGTDRGLAAGGASLIGAAALGGLVLMRRRRTDESFV